MLGIKVYNQFNEVFWLELYPNTKLSIEKLTAPFNDDLKGADFSLPIEVPFSDKNRKNLGFSEMVQTPNYAIPEYWRCDIYSNNIPVLQDAKLKLLTSKGRYDYKEGAYNFTVSGVRGLLGSKLAGKKLKSLQLCGTIRWDQSIDSRQFAKKVMDNQYPELSDKIGFFPIYCGDFFDTTRSDYLNEFIHNQIVNNVLEINTEPYAWTFARTEDNNPNAPITPGHPGYENYRTIPFLNLFYIVKQIFIENGYTVTGTFFEQKDFEKLYIFNNNAIEFYDYPFTTDINREIVPGNHLPNVLIIDFLADLQNIFNLKIIPESGFNVRIDFKHNSLNNEVKDFTNKTIQIFEESEINHGYYGGSSLKFEFDNDGYKSDAVKDISNIALIAEFNTINDLLVYSFPFALDDSHYVYILAENYYYRFNPVSGKWEPYSEWLNNFEELNSALSFSTKITPVCQHYALDMITGISQPQNMIGVRMLGSYYNNARMKVDNDYGIKLFYGGRVTTGSYTNKPISFTHNYNSSGDKLADISLSWMAQDGLRNKLWLQWINFLKNSKSVRKYIRMPEIDLVKIQEDDIIKIESTHYLIKELKYELPLDRPVQTVLVKIM